MLIEAAFSGGAKEVWLVCKDVDESWKTFCSQFELVRAAGGLVANSKEELLFIFRHGKWDLPKGKIEVGEKDEDAAVREVEEECSLFGLELGNLLCTTWHTYIQEGVPMIKPTLWYLMKYPGSDVPKPQEIEGITEIQWFPPGDLKTITRNTYPSVIDVIEEFRKKSGPTTVHTN